MAKIFSQAQMDEIYAYFKDKMNSLQCIRMVELVPFEECTWEQIYNITKAYYDGLYSLEDITKVWNIGDSNTFTIPKMSGQPEQPITMEIIDFNHDTLETSIGDKTKGLITLSAKNMLDNTMQFSDNLYSDAKYSASTNDVAIWMNGTLYNNLPTEIKNSIKTTVRSYGSGTNNKNIKQNIFLLTPYEIGESRYGSWGTPYAYYANTPIKTNKTKRDGTNARTWYNGFTTGGGGQRYVATRVPTNNLSISDDFMSYSYGVVINFCI